MKEVACQFGENDRLHGILSKPTTGTPRSVSVILVSAGFTSTPGPFRLYTLLARELAATGITTLRFDLGGIGNSEELHSNLVLAERTKLDIKAAIDYLAKLEEGQNIALCGLCSGAEDSFIYAETDKRVKALVLIDPHCYRTNGFYLRKFFSLYPLKATVIKSVTLLNWLKTKWDAVTHLEKGGEKNEYSEQSLIDYRYLSLEQSSRILSVFINRETLLHYIYTGSMLHLFNHPKQLKEIFEPLIIPKWISLDHLVSIEHTQLLEEDRDLLIRSIVSRFEKWF